jgi:hypothetical protein
MLSKTAVHLFYVTWGIWLVGWFMVLNAIFNNIPVLLVEETGVPGENHRPVASHWPTLSHNVVSSTRRLNEIRTQSVSGDGYWLHM